MKIIIDAMGGDFAPEAPVRGALLAREKYGADIILTGRTADILRELEKAGCKAVSYTHLMGQIGGVLGVVLGTLLGNINLQMPVILGGSLCLLLGLVMVRIMPCLLYTSRL